MQDKSNGSNGSKDQKQLHLEKSLQYITEEYVLRMRELSLIKRIAEALIDATNQKKVILDITNIILDEIDAEICKLLLFDEDGSYLTLKARKSQDDEEGTYFTDEDAERFSTNECAAGISAETKNPIYFKDIKKDKKHKKDPVIEKNCRSVLCLPLFSPEEKIGVLVLSAPEPDSFSEKDQRILQIISNQAAIVLNNVQLVYQMQVANKKQEETLLQLKEAEKELSTYAEDLEKMVDKRTSELIQSEKMAVIGQLVASVAHELNNPLSIITGYVDMLSSEKGTPAEILKKLLKVKLATTRCAKIVNNLLRLSRKRKIEPEKVDINAIVEDTIELYDYQFHLSHISILKKLDKRLPTTIGDSQQLQQVFLNLVSNAHDALLQQTESRFLTIVTRREENNIICEFKDSGMGIKENELKQIFEPFYTTKDIGKGTGLGLSLSKEIMEDHDGEIEIDHNFSEGARFIVKVPIIDMEIAKTAERLRETNMLDISISILLIDEERDLVSFQRDILDKYGCEVHGTYYAQDAMDLIDKNEYDVIVMDYDTPGEFEGKNLLEKILESKPELKSSIVFTTAKITEAAMREMSEQGEFVFIEKPFLVKNYISGINRCLQRKY